MKYNELIGKTVRFCITEATGRRSSYYGARQGLIVSVDAGPRKGFVSVRVRIGSDEFIRNGWAKPVHLKVLRKELSMLNHGCGVQEGERFVPLGAWLAVNKIETIKGGYLK